MQGNKMATKLTSPALQLAGDVARTRNTACLKHVLKALLHQRACVLAGKPEAKAHDMSRMPNDFTDWRTFDRTENMVAEAYSLTEKKDLSMLCAFTINARKALRNRS